MIARILTFLVIVAALIGVLVYSQLRPVPDKASGFVEAHEIRVGSRVGGRIAKVFVAEGQRVKAGDLLIELEPFDLNERLAEAQGKLNQQQATLQRLAAGFRKEEIAQAAAKRDQLKANLEKLRAGPRKQDIAAAQALLDQAGALQALAQENFDRVKRLFETRNANQEEMDRATNDLKVNTATAIVRREQFDQLKEGTRKEDLAFAEAQLSEADQALTLMNNGSRVEDIDAAKAAVASQQSVVDTFQTQLKELRIIAPSDGVVEAVDIRPGDLLAANAAALSLQDSSELWIRAYVPENRLNLTTGQGVRVTVDSFAGRDFHGEVTFVSRQAEATPKNVQTPEERSKQVFRIKVTLKDGAEVLRPGMSADVWLK